MGPVTARVDWSVPKAFSMTLGGKISLLSKQYGLPGHEADDRPRQKRATASNIADMH